MEVVRGIKDSLARQLESAFLTRGTHNDIREANSRGIASRHRPNAHLLNARQPFRGTDRSIRIATLEALGQIPLRIVFEPQHGISIGYRLDSMLLDVFTEIHGRFRGRLIHCQADMFGGSVDRNIVDAGGMRRP